MSRGCEIFPILSGAASLLVMISFIFPLWQTGLLADWTADTEATRGDAAFYVTIFLFYLLNYFVIIFFNCALIFSVIRYLEDQSTTISKALKDASSVIHQIFGWALLSAVFGLLLNALERNQKVGRIVTSLLGSAWTALTYFVLPVIVVERSGPVPAVKRSIAILYCHATGNTLPSEINRRDLNDAFSTRH